jgi:GNAT superfamily N-acetyltransferase
LTTATEHAIAVLSPCLNDSFTTTPTPPEYNATSTNLDGDAITIITMTSVLKGGFGSPNGAPLLATNSGTEFVNTVCPLKGALDGYDNTIPCSKQKIHVPQNFCDAMAIREEVYGEQGVPLEAEFDEDDARSWHWVAYASVATHTTHPPKTLRRSDSGNTPADDARRASATATRVPVATIRLIPPPHGPNKYVDEDKTDKHADADPPGEEQETKHPPEPYIKLGRLAVLAPYRSLGLAKLLVNAALDYAMMNPDLIYRSPSPTALEMAQMLGNNKEREITWQGLVMIHAQANLQSMWEKHGFHEELRNDDGEVEIPAEPHWIEEGIEHVGMWKRLSVEKRKRLSLSSLDSS